MELTVEVHHEDHSYWAEVTRSDVAELKGCITEARTLRELAEYLEEALCIRLDDPAVRLITPQLAVGTLQLSATRAASTA